MTTNETDQLHELDQAVMLQQALEALLHTMPHGPETTCMQVLAARVTNALSSLQFGMTKDKEADA